MASVLLADDHASVRYVLALLLRRAGHAVLEADSGARAVQIAAAEQPDVVVTDLNMPDLPGVQVIAQLRDAVPDVRIVGLSGGGAHQTPRASLLLARQAGADDALAKPVANDGLLAAIDALLIQDDG